MTRSWLEAVERGRAFGVAERFFAASFFIDWRAKIVALISGVGTEFH